MSFWTHFVSTAEQVRSWWPSLGVTVASVFAVLAWRRERRRDELRDEERVREQAAQVAAWLAKVDVLPAREPFRTRMVSWVVVVGNGSQVPVYDLRASIYDLHGKLRSGPEPLRGPLALPDRETHVGIPHDVQRGLRVVQDEVLDDQGKTVHPENARPVSDYLVALCFRDAAGVQWKRDHLGVLTRQTAAGGVA